MDKRSEEQDAELVKLTTEGQKIEPEIRAAIVAEDDKKEVIVEGDAETRELQLLTERASVGDILLATFEKRQTEGAPAELQKHYKLSSHQVPLEMLRINRSVEERAAATVPDKHRPRQSQAQVVITPVFSSAATAQFHGNRAAHSTNVGDAAYPSAVHYSESVKGPFTELDRKRPRPTLTFVANSI